MRVSSTLLHLSVFHALPITLFVVLSTPVTAMLPIRAAVMRERRPPGDP